MTLEEALDKQPNSVWSDQFLTIIAALFFLSLLWFKFYAWFLVWIKPLNHKIVIGLILSTILAFLCEWAVKIRKRNLAKQKQEASILAKEDNAVFCGLTEDKEDVFIKTRQRSMHTQVIGTTNAGKTESVILPWAIQDIQQGRGLILIDGKADRGLLDKLWAYTKKAGREKDFRLFSLSHIEESVQFNPLIGGTPEEVSERVFNSFEFENPYYRSIQFEVFSQMMRVFHAIQMRPTFLRLHQAITTPRRIMPLVEKIGDEAIKQWFILFTDLSMSDRAERTSGLTAALSHFAFGEASVLFNTENPSITLDDALAQNQIIYFQLPVLLSPFLGKATGKMVLQSLQSAVANRHRRKQEAPNFYSVFLDDFTEYLYPGFVSVLNKSRSANVGVVFAHQALGDIKTLGDAIANSILTNANLKVFMRGNDPESAEYFSKVIGTVKAMKYTERTKKGILSKQETGDASAREVDEFIVHPNFFKSELGVGQAVMVVPHEAGSKAVKIKFQRFPDLETEEFEKVLKVTSAGLPVVSETPAKSAETVDSKDPYNKEGA